MNSSFENYVIQQLDTSDPAAFFNLIDENRERLAPFFPGTSHRARSLKQTSVYMEEVREQMQLKTYLPNIIVDNNTSKYVGMVDFKNIDWRVPKAELGYLIDKEYVGRGIITKAARLVIEFAIAEYSFRKILCRISPTNPGSINVAKRLGFEFEGNIRNDFISPNGEPIDLHYYGKIY